MESILTRKDNLEKFETTFIFQSQVPIQFPVNLLSLIQ